MQQWSYYLSSIPSELYSKIEIHRYITCLWYVSNEDASYIGNLNFLHSFLSLILRNFLGLISKFQIFFEKLALFRARDLEHCCVRNSSTAPVFNYLRLATAQWNFLHSVLSLNPSIFFGIYFEIPNIFQNNLTHLKKTFPINTVSS